MSFDLPFRVAFYCASVVFLVYGQTLCLSTCILALGAWLGYPHAVDNSTGEEVLAYAITWVSALVTAICIGGTLDVWWLTRLEWKLITKNRSTIRGRDLAAWCITFAITIIVFLVTVIVRYDTGSFYRFQSLVWLMLLLIVVYVYDNISIPNGYYIVPHPTLIMRHVWVAVFVIGSVIIDIIVRDSGVWKWVVPAIGIWMLLQLPKILILFKSNQHKKIN